MEFWEEDLAGVFVKNAALWEVYMRNTISNDEGLIKDLGISKELTECPYTGGRIYNDHKWGWLIHVFPPENNQYLH